MTLTYKEKVMGALSKAKTADDIEYITDKVRKTPTINRRTKAGREETQELLELINKRYEELIDTGLQPF